MYMTYYNIIVDNWRMSMPILGLIGILIELLVSLVPARATSTVRSRDRPAWWVPRCGRTSPVPRSRGRTPRRRWVGPPEGTAKSRRAGWKTRGFVEIFRGKSREIMGKPGENPRNRRNDGSLVYHCSESPVNWCKSANSGKRGNSRSHQIQYPFLFCSNQI